VLWHLTRLQDAEVLLATAPRREAAAGVRAPGKRGPRTTLDVRALLVEVGVVLVASPFVGADHRKVWARLRQQQGIRSSMRRVLGIVREQGPLAHQRSAAVRGPQVHDRTIVTDRMWIIDATGCLADEGNATVFVLVDHCTGECLGIRVALRGTRLEAIECLRVAVWATRGHYEVGSAAGVSLGHDHGSQFMSRTFSGQAAHLRHRVKFLRRSPA
jgi:putative transposase